MKKILALFLMLLYILPNLGMGVSAHFCEGDLMYLNLSHCESDICPCTKKPIKKGNCENKKFCVKLTIDQNRAASLHFDFEKKINGLAFITPTVANYNSFLNDYLRHEPCFQLLRPPQKTSLPLYVLNRNFRV